MHSLAVWDAGSMGSPSTASVGNLGWLISPVFDINTPNSFTIWLKFSDTVNYNSAYGENSYNFNGSSVSLSNGCRVSLKSLATPIAANTATPLPSVVANTTTATRTPVASATPTQTLLATNSPSFVTGLDINGPAVTINGQHWLSASAAQAKGLLIQGALNGSKIMLRDGTDMARMLNTFVYANQEAGSLNLSWPIANGNYQFYLWQIENEQPNSRLYDVLAQHQPVASNLGSLLVGQWTAYGPYPAVVVDGTLNIQLIGRKGRPLLMGLSIFSH